MRPGQAVQQRLDRRSRDGPARAASRPATAPSSCRRGAGLRRAAPVVAVAREAQLLVDRLAALASRPARRRVNGGGPTTPAATPRPAFGGRIEDRVGDELDAARLVGVRSSLDRGRRVGHLQRVERQHRLNARRRRRVLRQRAVVVGERPVAAPCRASRWRESPGSASADSGPSSAARTSAASSAPSPSSVQSAWNRASRFGELRATLLQRRHDRLVLLEHEQLLRGVAPPAVRMAEVRDQLRRRLVQHPRLGAVARACRRSVSRQIRPWLWTLSSPY